VQNSLARARHRRLSLLGRRSQDASLDIRRGAPRPLWHLIGTQSSLLNTMGRRGFANVRALHEAPTHSYGPLAVNAEPSWSGTFSEPNDGWWNFDFVSPSTNGSRLANQDAACKIKIS
jgi:hypothetical protein